MGLPPMPGAGGLGAPRMRKLFLSGVNDFTASGMSLSPLVLQKVQAATQAWKKHKPAGNTTWLWYSGKYYITDFQTLTDAEAESVVDEIWKEIIDFHPYHTPVSSMVDPGPGNFNSSLDESIKGAFSQMGFCYRCDTREPKGFETTGWKPRYSWGPPPDITGTVLSRCCANGVAGTAGFWKDNVDIVNETSVCVSRTLRGVPKFPEPEYTGKAIVYAFKLSPAKQGVDTEALQPSNRRWQPGEKAFAELTWSEVMAWIPIMKFGSRDKQGTRELLRYEFLEAEWHYTAACDPASRTFLSAELQRHRNLAKHGMIQIKAADDFVRE